MTAIVTRGNAADLHLPDGTVDLVVTSPPYFGLRSYQDAGEHYAGQVGDEATPAEYLDALIACTAEWMRVLKPGGSIFVNLGDKYEGSGGSSGHVGKGVGKGQATATYRNSLTGLTRVKSLHGLPWRYAIRCIDDLGLILRAEIVWAKPNGLPESVTDRVRRSHEQVFHFVKSPRYFASVDEVRQPHKMRPQRRPSGRPEDLTPRLGQPRQAWSTAQRDEVGVDGHPLGALPGSVWEIPTAPLCVPDHVGVDHFAAYPPELVRRIVLGWSPVGGVVLDPFGGTGTTALVASCYGRIGISVDLSADYCRLARWRTTDPGERARVLKVDKPPVQVDGQLGMFEGIGA